jgi:hypothetical protein
MTDFVARQKPYKGLTDRERDELLSQLVKLIKKRKRVGVVGSMSNDDYNALAPDAWKANRLSAYTVAAIRCLRGIGGWADSTNYTGQIAYVFHSGSKYRRELDTAISWLARHGRTRAHLRYAGHSFSKQLVPPLQAADLWVWEYVSHFKKTALEERPSRASLQALVGKNPLSHHIHHLSRAELRRFFVQHPDPRA